jgi:hypothetical protein
MTGAVTRNPCPRSPVRPIAMWHEVNRRSRALELHTRRLVRRARVGMFVVHRGGLTGCGGANRGLGVLVVHRGGLTGCGGVGCGLGVLVVHRGGLTGCGGVGCGLGVLVVHGGGLTGCGGVGRGLGISLEHNRRQAAARTVAYSRQATAPCPSAMVPLPVRTSGASANTPARVVRPSVPHGPRAPTRARRGLTSPPRHQPRAALPPH